jgi:hypothetical protein
MDQLMWMLYTANMYELAVYAAVTLCSLIGIGKLAVAAKDAGARMLAAWRARRTVHDSIEELRWQHSIDAVSPCCGKVVKYRNVWVSSKANAQCVHCGSFLHVYFKDGYHQARRAET